MIIKVTNIHKSYGETKVLRGVDLEIQQNEVVSIVGSSGAGKSTLLHILGTLDLPDEGELEVVGKKLNGLSKKELASFRNTEIGFVFQFHNLLAEFTALENVCLPAFIADKKSKKDIEAKAKELLELLGLSHRMDNKPSQLSGGEQQRVAVARALINDPQVVFADEPSGNLDSENSKALHALFFDLRDRLNKTFVIVTHNEELASLSDRKIVMKDGIVIV